MVVLGIHAQMVDPVHFTSKLKLGEGAEAEIIFHATIDGNALSITKEDEAIPFAQAIVVKASTGSVVLNQQFTNSLQEQISNAGAYVLRIETAGGALVGQFIVQ